MAMSAISKWFLSARRESAKYTQDNMKMVESDCVYLLIETIINVFVSDDDESLVVKVPICSPISKMTHPHMS